MRLTHQQGSFIVVHDSMKYCRWCHPIPPSLHKDSDNYGPPLSLTMSHDEADTGSVLHLDGPVKTTTS
ncbi:hypothetical protein LCGC14_0975790 [marine sediment metagenome]|uniref:Uncharacterized protein n=1 Tax=marine sediment metagenome TaxID=412755 RepID=A0A0F9NA93_9ZZZZ